MPYNTTPAYRGLSVSIDPAGAPDTVLEAWGAEAGADVTSGVLADGIGDSVLVSGWITFYDPGADDWPIIHRAPFRDPAVPTPDANLPWTVGGQRIYRWTNPDAGVEAATLDGYVTAHDGDLYCEVVDGDVTWL